jgi:hypothetical protein
MNFFVVVISALMYGCAEHRESQRAKQEELDLASTNLMASEKPSGNLVPAKRNPIQRARRRKSRRRAKRGAKREKPTYTLVVAENISVTTAPDLGTSVHPGREQVSNLLVSAEESPSLAVTTAEPLVSIVSVDPLTLEYGTERLQGFETDVDEPPLCPTTPTPEGKQRSMDILMRALNEYLQRIHVNKGTVDPDWEELGALDIAEETLVNIVEEVREFQLSLVITGPSCKLTQLLSLQKMGVSLDVVLGRLSGMITDKRVCAMTSRYRDMLASMEETNMNPISNEVQERLNALYLLYESLIIQRLKLEDSTISLMNFTRGLGRVTRQMARGIESNA